MEVLVLNSFSDGYRGRRVLVTGHTGFKGSWLCLWLTALGAEVIGLALDPDTDPSHWSLLDLAIRDHRVDIRDADAVRSVFETERPEMVFHLAAQPLVRRSYREPLLTWSSNVMGTAHILEAVRTTPQVRAAVVVTSDKCYENREWPWAYRERDRLGGYDPYSASKAATELVAASYRTAYLSKPGSALVATARGGNVIGGGDWSEDRLIPDLVRATVAGERLTIRSPGSTRPWQHVLDCLSGYLVLGQRLLSGDHSYVGAWNFGPDDQGSRTVAQVCGDLMTVWPQLGWKTEPQADLHEAGMLKIDSSKAKMDLKWRPVWGFEEAIRRTGEWYRTWMESGAAPSVAQLEAYVANAVDSGLEWACR